MSTLKTNRIENNAGTAGFDVATIPDGGGFSMRNKLINGGFDIWQRGTSFTNFGFTADRWYGNTSGATASFTKSSFGLLNAITMDVTGASDYAGFIYKVEDATPLKGQEVTVSYYAKSSSLATLSLSYNTADVAAIAIGADTLTNAWVRYSHTFTVTSGGVDDSYFRLLFLNEANETSNIEFAQVQLEEGSVATPFEQRPIGMELALCQRYYWRSFAYPHYILAPRDLRTPTRSYLTITFPTTMRSTPDVTFGTIAGTPLLSHVSASGARFETAQEVPTATGINDITADAEL